MTPLEQILALVRPEILALTPYSSARQEFAALPGAATPRAWLDANENPITPHAGAPRLNRYPEPQPAELVARLVTLYGVTPGRVLVTRGSDEGIDLLLRAFCAAGRDAILITPPTYGMYAVSAGIQGARVVTVPLDAARDFALEPDALLATAAATPGLKLVFLCSPNNPTGQLLDRDDVLRITQALAGRAVVVVDEAYAEFALFPSLAADLAAHPNLVVLRTLSKAYGLAGARVGVTLGDPALLAVLRKILAPYPIPTPVLRAALEALAGSGIAAARASAQEIVNERSRLATALAALPAVRRVWPSDANFLLVQMADAARALAAARAAGVIWRDRRKDVPDALRITVGTSAENDLTLQVLAAL